MSLLHRDLPQPPPCPPLSLPKGVSSAHREEVGGTADRGCPGPQAAALSGPLAAAPRTPLVGGRPMFNYDKAQWKIWS